MCFKDKDSSVIKDKSNIRIDTEIDQSFGVNDGKSLDRDELRKADSEAEGKQSFFGFISSREHSANKGDTADVVGGIESDSEVSGLNLVDIESSDLISTLVGNLSGSVKVGKSKSKRICWALC